MKSEYELDKAHPEGSEQLLFHANGRAVFIRVVHARELKVG